MCVCVCMHVCVRVRIVWCVALTLSPPRSVPLPPPLAPPPRWRWGHVCRPPREVPCVVCVAFQTYPSARPRVSDRPADDGGGWWVVVVVSKWQVEVAVCVCRVPGTMVCAVTVALPHLTCPPNGPSHGRQNSRTRVASWAAGLVTRRRPRGGPGVGRSGTRAAAAAAAAAAETHASSANAGSRSRRKPVWSPLVVFTKRAWLDFESIVSF